MNAAVRADYDVVVVWLCCQRFRRFIRRLICWWLAHGAA